jgi:hypothetical protein
MTGFVQRANEDRSPLSHFLVRLKRALIVALLLLLALYVGDYVVVRVRIAKRIDPYGVVQVRRSYAVTMKNGKPEYFFESPADQTCIHSLFPHFGYPPCWYLRRRTTQQVKM